MKSLSREPQLLLLCVCAAGVGGCVAIPFASPPARLTIHAGPSNSGPQEDFTAEPPSVEPVIGLRASVHPLQLFPGHRWRKHDLGIGYLFEADAAEGSARPATQGAFLEVGLHAWELPFEEMDASSVRLRLFGSAEVLFAEALANTGSRVGWGASVGLTCEVLGFANEGVGAVVVREDPDDPGDLDAHALFGYAWGEVGMGLTLLSSLRVLEDDAYWTVTAGITITLPAAVGVVFVPIWDHAEDDTEEEEQDHEEGRRGRRRERGRWGIPDSPDRREDAPRVQVR